MADVFISYARPDRSQALELATELRSRGYNIWIDRAPADAKKNWASEIIGEIDGCSTLLCLLSPQSIASTDVAKEIQLASERQKNILPVMIDDRPGILSALESLYLGVAATEEIPLPSMLPDDRLVRVAVLPFDDLSAEQDNKWFTDGMMDELISMLAGIDSVKVPSRSDVMHYRGRAKKSREIARELGVRYLIEGGIRKVNDKIRINASLTDTVRGEVLWTDKFDGTFDDVFEFQETIAHGITQALRVQITPKAPETTEARSTPDIESYKLFLQGRHEQYYLTRESYLRALNFYEQAAAVDPSFARAYIAAASVCCAYYREYSKEPKWIKRAEENLAKTEAITGETARSLYVRGMIEWLKGDDSAAIATLTRSVELDPKYHSSYNILGVIHMENGDFPAAAEAFQSVVNLTENTQAFFNLLGALDGDENSTRRRKVAQQSLPVFNRHLLREPADYQAAVSRCYVLLWAGKKDEADQAAAHLLYRNDLTGIALYNLGFLYGLLGKVGLYLTLFRKAIAHGYREIGQTRNVTFNPDEAPYELEFRKIQGELDQLIEREKGISE
jgi:adenylate cyclase